MSTNMSFLENSSAELLRELSAEQQELVSGGATYEYQYTDEKYVEEHSQQINGENTEVPLDPFEAIERELGSLFWKPFF